jgi:hypothetical protein
LKEYVELRKGWKDTVHIYSSDTLMTQTDIRWLYKIKAINKFADDGWLVKGYTEDSVLMERDKI